MHNKHRFLIIVSFLLSGLLLWLALKDVALDELGRDIANSQWSLAFPMLLAYALCYWFKAVRWRLLLQPLRRTSARVLVTPMMMGFFANNLLPAHMGEFVRMYLGAKRLELGYAQVLASIVLERIFDIFAVVFFLGLALLSSTDLPQNLTTTGYIAAMLGLMLLILVILYVAWTQTFLNTLRRLLIFLPDKLRHMILTQLELGAHGLHAIKQPGLIAGIVATSLLQWFLMGVAIFISFLAVGVAVDFSAAFVVLALAVVAVSIPSAPGFFGAIQAAYVYALMPFLVAKNDAIAASVFYHLFTYLAVTLPGFYLLHRLGLNFRQIRQESESAETRL